MLKTWVVVTDVEHTYQPAHTHKLNSSSLLRCCETLENLFHSVDEEEKGAREQKMDLTACDEFLDVNYFHFSCFFFLFSFRLKFTGNEIVD